MDLWLPTIFVLGAGTIMIVVKVGANRILYLSNRVLRAFLCRFH
jgi:hypothetical protein